MTETTTTISGANVGADIAVADMRHNFRQSPREREKGSEKQDSIGTPSVAPEKDPVRTFSLIN